MKIALASCNGMSPNALVSRVAVGDVKKDNENVVSICMGSTSADIEGVNNEMLKKYPIIAINGCGGECVNKILNNKGISVFKTINIPEILDKHNIQPNDAFRLDDVGERCVEIVKNEVEKNIQSILDNS